MKDGARRSPFWSRIRRWNKSKSHRWIAMPTSARSSSIGRASRDPARSTTTGISKSTALCASERWTCRWRAPTTARSTACQSHGPAHGGVALAALGCVATTNDDHGHRHPSERGDDDAATTTIGDYRHDHRARASFTARIVETVLTPSAGNATVALAANHMVRAALIPAQSGFFIVDLSSSWSRGSTSLSHVDSRCWRSAEE